MAKPGVDWLTRRDSGRVVRLANQCESPWASGLPVAQVAPCLERAVALMLTFMGSPYGDEVEEVETDVHALD